MTISYPLDLPTAGGVRNFAIRGMDVVGMQASPITLEQTLYDWGGDMMAADVELVPMRRADAEVWVAWFLSLRGVLGTFVMGEPLNVSPQGTWAGAPQVAGAHAAGVRVVALDGFTAAATGKAGDWLQFGSGSSRRLHKVLQDFTADGSGEASVDLWPRLRADLADNAAIVTASPKGRWRLASNTREWSIGLGQLYQGLRFSCVEDLSG